MSVTVRKLIVRRQKSSVRQEKRIAISIGGRRVAGSGSLPGQKGDVTHQEWLIEAKQTKAPRFSLTLGLFRKIENEAFRKSKRPVMVVELAGRSLAIIDYNDFLALT